MVKVAVTMEIRSWVIINQSHMPVIIKQDTLPGLIESHLNDLSGRGSYGLPFPAGESERVMI